MITTVTGWFRKFEVTVEAEGEDFTKLISANVTADIPSIDTNNEQRNVHLLSDDFFNAEKYAELKFVSERYEGNNKEGRLYGQLTIRDVTKNIELKVEAGGIMQDPYGQTKAGFTVNGKISRKEFGLKWNVVTDAGGVVAGDEVKIHAEIQLVKQQ